jgi:molecular chaperone GrpE
MTDKPQPKRDDPSSRSRQEPAPHEPKNGTARGDHAQSDVPEAGAQNEPAEGASEAPAPAGDAAILSLREQLEAARAERDANYDLYLRAQAELQNYRKRVQRESEELRQYQALPLARDLLPALDNLHRTLAAAETSKNIDELVKGVSMVAKQIESALSRHQVVAIEAEGKPFDPNLHHALQHVPSAEHPPMTVVQEVERGFTLKDRVVRPATVIVAKPPAEDRDEAPSDAEEPHADV